MLSLKCCVFVYLCRAGGWDVLRGQQKTYRGQTFGLKDNIKEVVARFKADVQRD